jgi:hypothetical protein
MSQSDTKTREYSEIPKEFEKKTIKIVDSGFYTGAAQ